MNKPKLCYKYVDRSTKNSTENAISELGKLKQFDMSIATTENIIGGHRFVLSMFSKYFREVVSTAPPHTVIFTRIEYPPKIVSSLLELFYESVVVIDPEDRESFESLLKQMRVGDVKRSVVMDANRSAGAKIEMVRPGGNVEIRSMGRPVGGLASQSGLEIRQTGRIGGSLKHKQEMDKKSSIGQKIDITPARIVADNNNAASQSDNVSNNGGKYMQSSQISVRQRKPTPVDPNLGQFSPATEPIKNEAEEEQKQSSDSEDEGEGDAQSESGSDDMDIASEI